LCRIPFSLFDSEVWRADSRAISKERANSLRQDDSAAAHSLLAFVQMGDHLSLKGKLISPLIDGAKRGNQNFYVVVADSALRLDFADLLNFEPSFGGRPTRCADHPRIEHIGCPTSGVTQRAMRAVAPHARGVSKARQF
jgi:hypothetical protein